MSESGLNATTSLSTSGIRTYMSTVQDGLICAIRWAYVLLAPYTKVEDSFNLHTKHDVLMYGVKSATSVMYAHMYCRTSAGAYLYFSMTTASLFRELSSEPLWEALLGYLRSSSSWQTGEASLLKKPTQMIGSASHIIKCCIDTDKRNCLQYTLS